MNIDKMEAGRELDALVAEKVMGWNVCGTADNDRAGIAPGQTASAVRIPPYSTDIAAAWEVVERIIEIEKAKKTYLPVFSVQMAPDGFSAVLQVGMGCEIVVENSSTASLAICRAALKAALRVTV